jgi:hypothetical protein
MQQAVQAVEAEAQLQQILAKAINLVAVNQLEQPILVVVAVVMAQEDLQVEMVLVVQVL